MAAYVHHQLIFAHKKAMQHHKKGKPCLEGQNKCQKKCRSFVFVCSVGCGRIAFPVVICTKVTYWLFVYMIVLLMCIVKFQRCVCVCVCVCMCDAWYQQGIHKEQERGCNQPLGYIHVLYLYI